MKIIKLLCIILLSAVTSAGIFYLIYELFVLPKRQGTAKVEKTVKLDNSLLAALIIVEGNEYVGSGFFAKLNGKTYLFSNIHVLMGNSQVTFADRNGKTYKPVKAEAAKDRDIVRLEVAKTPTQVFNIITPQIIETPVVVCGNPHGGKVLRNLPGKLIGIGPKRVETDAKFVSGNSGGPIINKDGVVGIATFVFKATVDWTSTNTPFAEVRRFGYRLDNVPEWLPIDTKKFLKQGNFIDRRLRQLYELDKILMIWVMDPYWSELPVHNLLSGSLRQWIIDHNFHRDQHLRQFNSATEYGFTKGEEVQINSQMQMQLKIEAEELMTALSSFITVPLKKWHIPYFESGWEDVKLLVKNYLKGIEYSKDAWLNVNPIRSYNPHEEVEF